MTCTGNGTLGTGGLWSDRVSGGEVRVEVVLYRSRFIPFHVEQGRVRRGSIRKWCDSQIRCVWIDGPLSPGARGGHALTTTPSAEALLRQRGQRTVHDSGQLPAH